MKAVAPGAWLGLLGGGPLGEVDEVDRRLVRRDQVLQRLVERRLRRDRDRDRRTRRLRERALGHGDRHFRRDQAAIDRTFDQARVLGVQAGGTHSRFALARGLFGVL